MTNTQKSNIANDFIAKFQKLDEYDQDVISRFIDRLIEQKHSTQNKVIDRKDNVLTIDFRR